MPDGCRERGGDKKRPQRSLIRDPNQSGGKQAVTVVVLTHHFVVVHPQAQTAADQWNTCTVLDSVTSEQVRVSHGSDTNKFNAGTCQRSTQTVSVCFVDID